MFRYVIRRIADLDTRSCSSAASLSSRGHGMGDPLATGSAPGPAHGAADRTEVAVSSAGPADLRRGTGTGWCNFLTGDWEPASRSARRSSP